MTHWRQRFSQLFRKKLGTDRGNGVFYYLGNASHQISHAYPLYQILGGEFVVVSRAAYRECRRYNVPVRRLDNSPTLKTWEVGASLPRTVRFLNENAKVVLFYDTPEIVTQLSAPLKVMLFHGNSLKGYVNADRLERLMAFDYLMTLGPKRRQDLLGAGLPPAKLVDIGLVRWDAVVKHAGQVIYKDLFVRTLGFDPTKPTIAYLPTWYGPSTIHNLGKELLKNLSADYNVIFRPHPDTDAAVIAEYLKIIEKRKHIRYLPEGLYPELDLAKIYAVSDLFIGDMSSVMIDVLLTDKPIIYAFDTDAHRQSEEVYQTIAEVFAYCEKLDLQNVEEINKISHRALTKGIAVDAWLKCKDRMFFSWDGTAASSLAEFVGGKLEEQ